MESLIQLDQQLTLWINQHNLEALNGFWHFVSQVRVWFPFYGLIAGLIIWKLGWKKGLCVVAFAILGVVLTDQLANAFKEGFMRLRPCRDPWMTAHGVLCPDGIIGGMHSFYSGHASNTFGFAALTWAGLQLNDKQHSYRWLGWCLFLWAAIVSISRIMLAAHFLGDILVGALIGTAIGLALAYCSYWVITKARL